MREAVAREGWPPPESARRTRESARDAGHSHAGDQLRSVGDGGARAGGASLSPECGACADAARLRCRLTMVRGGAQARSARTRGAARRDGGAARRAACAPRGGDASVASRQSRCGQIDVLFCDFDRRCAAARDQHALLRIEARRHASTPTSPEVPPPPLPSGGAPRTRNSHRADILAPPPQPPPPLVVVRGPPLAAEWLRARREYRARRRRARESAARRGGRRRGGLAIARSREVGAAVFLELQSAVSNAPPRRAFGAAAYAASGGRSARSAQRARRVASAGDAPPVQSSVSAPRRPRR